MFCDKVSIKIKAGDGGDGIVSFLHEKYKEFGGPDGGDGAKGGDVVLKADDNLNTLYFYKTHKNLRAENGERGKKRRSHGKNGKDLILSVPRGTVIINEETGERVADLSDRDQVIAAKGGQGGFGNAHFTSSTRQTPKVAELGEPGEEFTLTLELKLIADVGLIGLPNVGKSTFLSVVSAARPKIADYEFTTLVPNLGVIEEGKFGVGKGFVAADIPGLIEGASIGKGLGDEFLRHIERTRVLLHFLDATHEDLAQDYKVIRKELAEYKVDLSERPEVVVVNKCDAILDEDLEAKIKNLKKKTGLKKVFKISAVAHKGISEVLHEAERILAESCQVEEATETEEYRVFTIEDVVDEDHFEVSKEDGVYVLSGPKVERFAIRTDFSNPYGVARFRDILKKLGIDKELRRKGAGPGDKVRVINKEFEL